MSDEHTVLLLGGTGRTGRRVLEQFLGRGVSVRAIVRPASRLPQGAAGNPRLTLIVADLLSLADDELRRLVAGCDAVVSCLGHTTPDPFIQWVAVRPDTLVEGDVSEYAVHHGLVSGLFAPPRPRWPTSHTSCACW